MKHPPPTKQHRKVPSVFHIDSLEAHCRRLGLKSVQDYRPWCRQRGLPGHFPKHPRFLDREARIANERIISGPYRRWKAIDRRIQALYESRDPIIDKLRQRLGYHSLEILFERSTLLNALSDRPFGKDEATYSFALLKLAEYDFFWIRPLKDWKCPGGSLKRHFHSLTRHLLARAPVPAFLDSAWFCSHAEPGYENRYCRWFFGVALGRSIRQVRYPPSLRGRGWHYFLHTPPSIPVCKAAVWASARGWGASPRLARRLVHANLQSAWLSDPQWGGQYIRLLCEAREISDGAIRLSALFLHAGWNFEHEIEPANIAERLDNKAWSTIGLDARPFRLKGRTFASLLRLANLWIRVRRDLFNQQSWPKAPFHDLLPTFQGEYEFRELCSTVELVEEQMEMENCLPAYAWKCAEGTSSIWSMRSRITGEPVANIEISPDTGKVVQMEGKRNSRLPAALEALILRWAEPIAPPQKPQ